MQRLQTHILVYITAFLLTLAGTGVWLALLAHAAAPTSAPTAAEPNERPGGAISEEATGKVRQWVEDFFHHNYRDITDRKTLEWREPATTALGNLCLRYVNHVFSSKRLRAPS